VLDGIDDGDPEILETLPYADLSGQWADGVTPQTLCEHVGIDDDDDDTQAMLGGDLCDAYEEGFNTAAGDAVAKACRAVLADDDDD
jgi:hypothetical protein